jgi:hypothetical protein
MTKLKNVLTSHGIHRNFDGSFINQMLVDFVVCAAATGNQVHHYSGIWNEKQKLYIPHLHSLIGKKHQVIMED